MIIITNSLLLQTQQPAKALLLLNDQNYIQLSFYNKRVSVKITQDFYLDPRFRPCDRKWGELSWIGTLVDSGTNHHPHQWTNTPLASKYFASTNASKQAFM